MRLIDASGKRALLVLRISRATDPGAAFVFHHSTVLLIFFYCLAAISFVLGLVTREGLSPILVIHEANGGC